MVTREGISSPRPGAGRGCCFHPSPQRPKKVCVLAHGRAILLSSPLHSPQEKSRPKLCAPNCMLLLKAAVSTLSSKLELAFCGLKYLSNKMWSFTYYFTFSVGC
ncbi:HEAT repeat-containing protein 3 [Platysternon megacephalum]|uniref:HEAT repeat-containing protein 3 n=1 Tax=Platysternon megacephalum TaxID=55544 RepID=A0A4D9EHT8_9SAUR|nr:HEAT repeat-containing protein 3 [Platysternon megacephalum]